MQTPDDKIRNKCRMVFKAYKTGTFTKTFFVGQSSYDITLSFELETDFDSLRIKYADRYRDENGDLGRDNRPSLLISKIKLFADSQNMPKLKLVYADYENLYNKILPHISKIFHNFDVDTRYPNEKLKPISIFEK